MRKKISDRDGYQTEIGPVCWMGKHFPTLYYYLASMAPIVWQTSRIAGRGELDSQAWGKSSERIVAALEGVGVRFKVSGLENVAALDSPCVFIANHMSTLETFCLPAMLLPHRSITFIVKKSLVDYPVFKHVMRSCDPVVVNRSNPRDDLKTVLTEGCKRLADNISIIVFPQTTRTATFQPEHFNTIGIKLAKKAGVPVVPLALKTDAWGNGRFLKDFGRIDPGSPVHFAFGPPLPITGRGQEEQGAVVSFITEHLAQWQQ